MKTFVPPSIAKHAFLCYAEYSLYKDVMTHEFYPW